MQHIAKCRFGSVQKNCSEIFARRRTEIGKCCAFNMNRPSQEEFWRGKIYNRSDQLYTKSSGLDMGLTLELRPHISDITYVLTSNIAFRVFILEPHNFPTDDMQPIIIGPNYEAFLSVIPRRIVGDRAMSDISAESRGCFFFDEPKLIYDR